LVAVCDRTKFSELPDPNDYVDDDDYCTVEGCSEDGVPTLGYQPDGTVCGGQVDVEFVCLAGECVSP
jgi:hypothetical protein